MSEAGMDGHVDEQARRHVPRPPRGRRLRHDSPEEHLPRPGTQVAGYRLERRLGSGGQGTVFRARREGRLFAVKLIYLPHSAHWAWRELDVMVKLWRSGGLPLEGHGLWPAREPLFLFLVTPFVRGLPLDVWTRVHNPTAREVAELVRQVARLLQRVHAAGVVHRDVKGANLLVDGERRLVLVDFGVATYEGAPAVTGPFPPGTWPYLSPRVWRAWRGEEESRACPGDDVWALGVELYQLLTGRLPFQGREGELVQAILHAEPEPPHEANPRVPRVLGELCQRMLRKRPGERFADARAFEAALEEAVKQADAAWEVPLGEAWGPENVTTGQQEGRPWLTGGEFEALHERLASYERRLVRGRPLPPDEVSTLGSPEAEPPGRDTPEPSATSEESTSEAVPPARSRWVRWATSALLVLGVCVGLAVWLRSRAPEPTPSPMETPQATLPMEFYPVTRQPGVQEVAPPGKPPEGDDGAVPRAATTPAPVARATPAQDTRVKTPAKATVSPQQPIEKNHPARTMSALVLTCTLATGCPSPTTTAQVRPTPLPPPAECPEGAAQAMKELGLLRRRSGLGHVWFGSGLEFGTVRPGPVTMRLSLEPYWGQLPEGTLFTGEVLFFGERVQGRFTQAHTPDGHSYPVCLELMSGPEWGWEKLEGSTQDSAKVINGANLEPVERFGEAWRYSEDRNKR